MKILSDSVINRQQFDEINRRQLDEINDKQTRDIAKIKKLLAISFIINIVVTMSVCALVFART